MLAGGCGERGVPAESIETLGRTIMVGGVEERFVSLTGLREQRGGKDWCDKEHERCGDAESRGHKRLLLLLNTGGRKKV